MKPSKKHSYIALFSVGVLTSQILLSPILLAEENTKPNEDYLTQSSFDEGRELADEEKSLLQSDSQNNELPTDQTTDLEPLTPDQTLEISLDNSHSSESEQETTLPVSEDVIETTPTSDSTEQEEPKIEEEGVEELDPEEEDFQMIEEEPAPETAPEQEDIIEVEVVPTPIPNESDSSEHTEPDESARIEDSTPPADKPANLPEQAPIIQAPSPSPQLTEHFYNGSASTELPEEFRASDLAESSLLGFTLPLLSAYEEEWQAAFVYAIIQQIGESTEIEDIEQWHSQLAEKISGETMKWETLQEVDEELLQPGDLIRDHSGDTQDDTGIYLGEGYQAKQVMVSEENEKIEDSEEIPTLEIQRVSIDEGTTVKRLSDSGLTEYGEELVTNYPAPFDFSANTNTQTFIDSFAQEAQELGQEYDVFASVLIAQAILESGSGSSGLSSSPHFNLFGIKGSHQGNSVTFSTMEDNGNGELFEIQAAFRSYGSYRDSMADYVELIRGGITGNTDFYQDVWRSEAKNYLRATDALIGTYATDINYSKKLNSLIAVYGLTQYDEAVVTETGVFVQGMDQIPAEYRSLMKFPEYNGRDYNQSGSYPVGQCTWYVFNRVHQLGGRVDDYMGNGGQWGATGHRLGYTVTQTPKVGSMISFAPGTAGSDPRYGHVAFVEAVGPNGILISEGNVYGGTTISYRVISNELALSSHVSYILPK